MYCCIKLKKISQITIPVPSYLPVMKYLFSFILLISFSAAWAQTPAKLEDIGNHVGDSISVSGKVYSIRYLESAKGAPTLMNLGAAFPNQLLTVVIFGEDRKNFKEAPETYYKDKTVTIVGKVNLYREKPQIVVQNPSQIIIRDEKQ
jgi:hypothetical protein